MIEIGAPEGGGEGGGIYNGGRDCYCIFAVVGVLGVRVWWDDGTVEVFVGFDGAFGVWWDAPAEERVSARAGLRGKWYGGKVCWFNEWRHFGA